MRVIKAAVLAGLLGLLAACNTVSGFGRDVQEGGQAITGTAHEAEQQM